MMKTITNIVFDLGGVIVTLDKNQGIERFRQLGISEPERWLNDYHQTGIFGELEEGLIDATQFMQQLGLMAGKTVTYQQCCYAWQGYAKDLPQRNLEKLIELKRKGYRLILLSNTNPFMMEWVLSSRFDGQGNGVDFYFDSLYLSYQHKMMKPDERFFRKMLTNEGILPKNTLFVDDGPRNVAAAGKIGIHTFCPVNGDDWTDEIDNYLI